MAIVKKFVITSPLPLSQRFVLFCIHMHLAWPVDILFIVDDIIYIAHYTPRLFHFTLPHPHDGPSPAVVSAAAVTVVISTVTPDVRRTASFEDSEARKKTLATCSGDQRDALHCTNVVERRSRQSDGLTELVVSFYQRLTPLLTLPRHTQHISRITSTNWVKVFTSHSTQNKSFRRRSSQPISWLSTEESKPNTTKNYPSTGLTIDASQLTFLPSSKSRDTKTRTNIKNLAWKI